MTEDLDPIVADIVRGFHTQAAEREASGLDPVVQQVFRPLSDTAPQWPSTVSPVNDPSRTVSPAATAVASMATSDVARYRAYAQELFPDMPIEQAMERMGSYNNEPVYLAEDGRVYYARPQGGVTAPGVALDRFAAGSGAALPTAGAMAGGALGGAAAGGATAGPVGAVLGTAAGGMLGAAGGEYTRQLLGQHLTGETSEEYTPAQRASDVALEGVLGLFETGIPRTVIGIGNRRTLPDVSRIDRTGIQAIQNNQLASVGLDDTGRIPVTAFEAANVPSGINRQYVLSGSPATSSQMQDFYDIRNDRVRMRFEDLMNSIAPAQDAATVGADAVQAADNAIQRLVTERRNAASPLYNQAFAEAGSVDVGGVLELIDSLIEESGTTSLASPLNVARRALTQMDADGVRVARTDLRQLHRVRINLQEMLRRSETRTDSLSNTSRWDITRVLDRLTGAMDEASPAYADARASFDEASDPIEQLRAGMLGRWARLDPNDQRVISLRNDLFNPRISTPQTVAQTREAFFSVGAHDQWYALVRSHLQDVLERVPTDMEGRSASLGTTLFRDLFSRQSNHALLAEALRDRPEVVTNIVWLGEALNVIGRTARAQSITHFAGQAEQDMIRASSGVAPALIEGASVFAIPGMVARGLRQRNNERYLRNLAEVIITPDGMDRMAELRTLAPQSERAIRAVGHMLMYGVRVGTGSGASISDPDRPPVALDATSGGNAN